MMSGQERKLRIVAALAVALAFCASCATHLRKAKTAYIHPRTPAWKLE